MALNQLKLQATDCASVDGGGSVGSDQTFTELNTLLFIGVGGNVKVDCSGSGTAIVFKNIPSGSVLPVKVSKIYSSGTTATDVVAIS